MPKQPLNKNDYCINIKPLIISIQRHLNIKDKISINVFIQDHTEKQKQYKFPGSTKTLNRYNCEESMNIENDNIIQLSR